MPVPDYQSLMLPVLRASLDGEVRIGDLITRLADELNLQPEDRAALLASGRQTVFANRVHWAKTYLAKAGLVEATRRGHFRCTPRGREVLASNPPRVDNTLLARFDEFRSFVGRENRQHDSTTPETLESEATPDEAMRAAHRQIEAALAQELLERVRSAPPDFFERLVVTLLLAMGYGGSVSNAGRALGGTRDGGIDGVIDQDALGLDRVYIQAKRYGAGNSVGSEAVRNFVGSLDHHRADKGVFVTTSSFTADARQAAERSSKKIVLIDAERLTELMIRHDIGCRSVETLRIRKLDEDFFE